MQALLERIEAEMPERVLLLGDLLYHGPRNDLPEGYAPKAVIPMLNGIRERVLAVRGNCDTEVDQMVLEFPIVESAQVLLGSRVLVLTHGHRFHLQNPPPLCPGDFLVYGHTHVPAWDSFGTGNRVLNPGSVSIPKEGSPRGYILLTERSASWKNLAGETWHSMQL